MIGGGYDLLPGTLELIDKGFLDFTIDQQPYLQGFHPVIQLFLYKLSGGLVAPSDTNTGLLFVTKANVKPYLTTKTRYEGSSPRSTPSRNAEAVAADADDEPRRAGFGWRVAGAFLRRREASIFVVAVGADALLPGEEPRSSWRATTSRTSPSRWRRSRSIAAGEVMLLICGEIDLAVGRVFALAPAIVWWLSIPDSTTCRSGSGIVLALARLGVRRARERRDHDLPPRARRSSRRSGCSSS